MTIDFSKGLVPAIIQDSETKAVLMLGYMNAQALQQTQATGKVTFFSRSKNRLWTKGETSGNFLNVVSLLADCDNDTILVQAKPVGPACHTGADTCFDQENKASATHFLTTLEGIIENRKNQPDDKSYTSSLFAKGINKIAQKVGEEAIEVVIEAKDDNRGLFLNESADLLFHYLILLQAKGEKLENVLAILKDRHKQ